MLWFFLSRNQSMMNILVTKLYYKEFSVNIKTNIILSWQIFKISVDTLLSAEGKSNP
jgi:hypothetical protein